MPCFWQCLPESAHILIGKFRRCRRRDRVHLIAARIKSGDETLYRAALPRRIPAFERDNDRNLTSVKLVMKLKQFLLQLFQSSFVLFICHIKRQIALIKTRNRLVFDRGVPSYFLQNRAFVRCFCYFVVYSIVLFVIFVISILTKFLINRLFHDVVHYFRNSGCGHFHVRRVENSPWRKIAVGAFDHFRKSFVIFVIFLMTSMIILCYAPARRRVVLETFESCRLLFLRYLQEELYDYASVVVKLTLKFKNIPDPTIYDLFRQLILDTRDRYFAVPAAVEN